MQGAVIEMNDATSRKSRNERERAQEQLVEMQTLENDSRYKGNTWIDAEEQALAGSTLHNPLTRG
jgi:hypothetical protein